MAGKDKNKELGAEELLDRYENENVDVEGLDENPIEEVPTIEILTDVLTQEKDNWRFIAFTLVFVVLALGYFLYDMSEKRATDSIAVFNQATGELVVAQAGDYKAEGFLSSVSRGVALFNTWDYDTFANTMALVSDVIDPALIRSAQANEKSKRVSWQISGYGQKLKVDSAAWPTDSNGTLQKWIAGYESFTVIVKGELTITRQGKSKSYPVLLNAYCKITTPSIKHPQGFMITSIQRAVK